MVAPNSLDTQGPEPQSARSGICINCRYWRHNCSKERPSCLRCRSRGLQCGYKEDETSPGEADDSSSSHEVDESTKRGDSESDNGDSELGNDGGASPINSRLEGEPLQATPAQRDNEAYLSYAAAVDQREESVKLYRIGAEILGAFQDLVTLEKPDWPESQHWLDSDSQRFRLWAHSLGLHRQGHASLDYRVRDVAVVRDRFADILDNLRDHLASLLSVMRGERPPLEESWSGEESSDTGPPSASSMSDNASSDSFHEVDFRQRSVAETVDALYSLASKIRNPRNRPQRTTRELYKHVPSHLRDGYIREREEIEISVVRHVQNQHIAELWGSAAIFENREFYEWYVTTENFLIRRTGIANARRKQQFVYWKEHAARIRDGTTARTPVALDDSFEQEQEQQQNVTELVDHVPMPTLGGPPQAAPISNHGRSLATSATRLGPSFMGFGDLQSVTTHQTRLSTAIRPQGGKLDWPPPPRNAADAKYFTCPYCHIICPRKYLSKDAWRSHLIHDLMPYHCTYEVCSDPNRLYGSYQEWLNHENVHNRVWHCRVHESEFETQAAYIQHLQQEHPEAKPESFSAELLAAAVGPASKARRNCPLCPEILKNSDIADMQKHMRYHLEHLALFSLPADPGDDDGVGDDASEKSSDSHQAIQRGGRRDSVDLDFDGSGPSSVASATNMDHPAPQPPSDQTAFDDIRRYSQERLAFSMNDWLVSQPEYQSYTHPPPPYHDFSADGDPPRVPPGWIPEWDEEYQRWFYVQDATGIVQWGHPAYNHDGQQVASHAGDAPTQSTSEPTVDETNN